MPEETTGEDPSAGGEDPSAGSEDPSVGGEDPETDDESEARQGAPELPDDAAEDAETLTREARAADAGRTDRLLAERDRLLDRHDFSARVREDDDGDVLVCHPQSWIVDGDVVSAAVEDPSVAVERRLSGSASPEEWDRVDARNRDLAAAVDDVAGEPYASVADVLADFAGNHYAKPITDLAGDACREFKTEYSRRNAWLSSDERAVVVETVALVFALADEPCPIDATPPSDVDDASLADSVDGRTR